MRIIWFAMAAIGLLFAARAAWLLVNYPDMGDTSRQRGAILLLGGICLAAAGGWFAHRLRHN